MKAQPGSTYDIVSKWKRNGRIIEGPNGQTVAVFTRREDAKDAMSAIDSFVKLGE